MSLLLYGIGLDPTFTYYCLLPFTFYYWYCSF